MEEKYLDSEPVGSSNGFWYDLTDGGYINPDEILVDKDKAKKINEAIKLLRDWEDELRDDEMLNEF